MNPETHHEMPEMASAETEDPIADALIEAGLGHVIAPKPGTKSYDRLIAAARGYMQEVKKVEDKSVPQVLTGGYIESDNYYRPKSELKEVAIKKISSSDTVRREYHDTMAVMLLGQRRKGMSYEEADRLSNFAAYVTGDLEYIDSWSK